MARQPQVTRTILTTKATVLVADLTTGKVGEKIVTVPREFKKAKKLREAVENAVNTDTEKLVHIKSTELVETLYGMSEQKFIANAEILPGRTKKSDEESSNEESAE